MAHVPSPADAPLTAAELVAKLRERGVSVYRMREPSRVFVLTQDQEIVDWLLRHGGRTHIPTGLRPSHLAPLGAYRRYRNGPWEWDIWISSIPVHGEQTIWEAAA